MVGSKRSIADILGVPDVELHKNNNPLSPGDPERLE
jgi:hypothetical protein